jgi:hypothetical protein
MALQYEFCLCFINWLEEQMENITDRIGQTFNVAPEFLSETPPAPKSAKIEVTSRCDFKCFFFARTRLEMMIMLI